MLFQYELSALDVVVLPSDCSVSCVGAGAGVGAGVLQVTPGQSLLSAAS